MQRFTYLLHKNAKPERSANSLPDNVTRYQCPYGGAQSASRRLNRTHLSKNHGINPPAVTGGSSTENCTQVRPIGLPTCVLCKKSFSHWKARETHVIKGHCINIDCQQPLRQADLAGGPTDEGRRNQLARNQRSRNAHGTLAGHLDDHSALLRHDQGITRVKLDTCFRLRTQTRPRSINAELHRDANKRKTV